MSNIIKILRINIASFFQEKVPCKQCYNKVKLNNRAVNMIYCKSLCGKEIGLTETYMRKRDSEEGLSPCFISRRIK